MLSVHNSNRGENEPKKKRETIMSSFCNNIVFYASLLVFSYSLKSNDNIDGQN